MGRAKARPPPREMASAPRSLPCKRAGALHARSGRQEQHPTRSHQGTPQQLGALRTCHS